MVCRARAHACDGEALVEPRSLKNKSPCSTLAWDWGEGRLTLPPCSVGLLVETGNVPHPVDGEAGVEGRSHSRSALPGMSLSRKLMTHFWAFIQKDCKWTSKGQSLTGIHCSTAHSS